MTVLTVIRKFVAPVVVMMAVCIGVGTSALAENPYSRKRVENHLRAMFVNIDIGRFARAAGGSQQIPDQQLFSFMAQKKRFRVFISGFKEGEVEPGKSILIELFRDILQKPVVAVHPDHEDIDLLVFISDNLVEDAKTPGYRAWLQEKGQSEESYIKKMTLKGPDSTKIITRNNIRSLNDHFVVAATQREHPDKNPRYTFEEQFRNTLFFALTSSGSSDIFQPSAVNGPSVKKKYNGFAPIDWAVLRAIFWNDDWPGMEYEASIQLLTDRVMEQLPTILVTPRP